MITDYIDPVLYVQERGLSLSSESAFDAAHDLYVSAFVSMVTTNIEARRLHMEDWMYTVSAADLDQLMFASQDSRQSARDAVVASFLSHVREVASEAFDREHFEAGYQVDSAQHETRRMRRSGGRCGVAPVHPLEVTA